MKSPLTIKLFGIRIRSFHFFGILGYILGTVLGIFLCNILNLQPGIILLMTLIGAATFFALAFLAKWITGDEQIVYYHHEIAILIFCSITLKILNLPVLNYMDITILGIATFLGFGRIGCFSVGCCHGRPSAKGVKYGHQHGEDGFPHYLENVTLFPIQLVESAFVFLVIISGSVMLFQQLPAGSVLIFYTAVYGAFRFLIEFFRGDAERPYFLGLSEAQWTTLILLAITLECSAIDLVPFYYWHLIIFIGLFIISLVTVIENKKRKSIFTPQHISQIALGLIELDKKIKNSKVDNKINMFRTDLGFIFSKGQFVNNQSLLTHYTISSKIKMQLSLIEVKKLAELISRLRHHNALFEIKNNSSGIFHILFDEFQISESKSGNKKKHANIF